MSEEFLKRVQMTVWVLLAVAAIAYVYQYGRSVNQAYPNKTFTVDGEARVETANDVATFSATVITEGGNNVSDIQSRNIDKMNAVNEYLKEKGVEKKDLQTRDYNLSPRYEYASCTGQSVCPPPRIVGYTLTQSLAVKVRNLDTLGDILAGVVERGANSVSNVSFVTDDDSDARNEARAEAIAEANEKAQAIAKAGNFRVGRLITLYEDAGVRPMNYDGVASMGMGGAAEKMPSIEPGTQTGTIRVMLTYEIRN